MKTVVTFELRLDNGECFDDSFEVDNVLEVRKHLISFVEGYFNEGVTCCDPRYHHLSDMQLEILGRRGGFYSNGVDIHYYEEGEDGV